MNNKNITILGAGCWGAAIATILKNNGFTVLLWDKNLKLIRKLKNFKKHPNMADFKFKNNDYIFSTNLKEAIEFSDIIFTVIPAQSYDKFLKDLKPFFSPNKLFINCSKGINYRTNSLISDLFFNAFPKLHSGNFLVLSGPSYAKEVIKKIPTAVTISGKNIKIVEKVQNILCNQWFRVYASTDIIGVELAGALKNVIAIASGIAIGIGYGCNTQAALITRGNAEIMRLGKAMKAKTATFSGLSGIGDLILTSTSEQSRNYSFGLMLGKGLTLDQAKNKINTVIEGIETTRAAFKLSKQYNVEMPICEKVYQILFKKMNPEKAVIELMSRSLGLE